jgi:hypothetical protein
MHISTIPVEPYPGAARLEEPEPDGLCHCDPQPDSDGVGMCPQCLRLDYRKARLVR